MLLDFSPLKIILGGPMTLAYHDDSNPGSAFLQFEGETEEEPDSRSPEPDFSSVHRRTALAGARRSTARDR